MRRTILWILGVLLVTQVTVRWLRSTQVQSDDHTATERIEPERLLSGSQLPEALVTQINALNAGDCVAVVFASPTCPGCAFLADNWDYSLERPVWVFEGDSSTIEAFREMHGLAEVAEVELGELNGLADLGVFGTPTWGYMKPGGVLAFVRVSSVQPTEPEKRLACS